MSVVAVVGATGFVGSACAAELAREGFRVVAVTAPRLKAASAQPRRLRAEAAELERTTRLAERLSGADIVLNAAGCARPTSGGEPELMGANALLPALIVTASARAGVRRVVHVSSAAVQGRRRVLDETGEVSPVNAYGRSKAAGEAVLLHDQDVEVVVLRATSVHGPDRAVTRRVVRLARSGLATVAAPGDDHTPQVHIDNVARAVVRLCQSTQPAPPIVLQPSEGWTTSQFLAAMGGKEPRQVPRALARRLVAATAATGRMHDSLAGQSRRLELLLFGQGQVPGWLSSGSPNTPAQAAWRRVVESACASES